MWLWILLRSNPLGWKNQSKHKIAHDLYGEFVSNEDFLERRCMHGAIEMSWASLRFCVLFQRMGIYAGLRSADRSFYYQNAGL